MKKNIIILGLISFIWPYRAGMIFLTTHPGDSVSTDLALSTEQDIDNAVNGLYDFDVQLWLLWRNHVFFMGIRKGMICRVLIIAGELVTGVIYMIIALQA